MFDVRCSMRQECNGGGWCMGVWDDEVGEGGKSLVAWGLGLWTVWTGLDLDCGLDRENLDGLGGTSMV